MSDRLRLVRADEPVLRASLQAAQQATEVDHILEVANGGTDDVENLQPLCNVCHKAKTNAFNSKRLKKSTNNGFFYMQTPQIGRAHV